jgi:hypothetical protein
MCKIGIDQLVDFEALRALSQIRFLGEIIDILVQGKSSINPRLEKILDQ